MVTCIKAHCMLRDQYFTATYVLKLAKYWKNRTLPGAGKNGFIAKLRHCKIKQCDYPPWKNTAVGLTHGKGEGMKSKQREYLSQATPLFFFFFWFHKLLPHFVLSLSPSWLSLGNMSWRVKTTMRSFWKQLVLGFLFC